METSYTRILNGSRAAEDTDEGFDGMTLIGGEKRKPYQQYDYSFESKHYHFYLNEEIGEPQLYTDMIHKISAAGPNDTVIIHLNSSGGDLSTGIQIISAMQNTQAKVITVLEGMAFSLATLIFLAGKELIINDHCLFMIHNFSGGIVGKGHEMASQLEATSKWFLTLAKKIYIPFLTEDELHRIIKGEDLWMHSPEIRKRLDRMIKAEHEELKPTKKLKVAVDEVTEDEVPPKVTKTRRKQS
jgi:ATP-dependent protease ClpP protease subunit